MGQGDHERRIVMSVLDTDGTVTQAQPTVTVYRPAPIVTVEIPSWTPTAR